ncbi:uncharacterized protein [Physcomitrium patens]|uniref:uncharacterized protein isoform X1 n=1 Tax=Physcomitrium patens TaxID=3218 RepID=UPI000D1580B1|nr:uncharacterized protein LOC112285497 [Physcomitrium patens]|eukprot:XP_024382144.1 uncharacterized protein LOC112285497 [Physcomitrella patens]
MLTEGCEDDTYKTGSGDRNYIAPELGEFNPTKPKPWKPNGPVKILQPDGVWVHPHVYGKKRILRFPVRPEVGTGPDGKEVKFREFEKPFYRSNHLNPLPPEQTPSDFKTKYIDPLAPERPDARDWTQRDPQYSVVPQKCYKCKPGPPTHNRLHKAVASGDKKHFCRVIDPEGHLHRKKGGGWMCRKWAPRGQLWPRDGKDLVPRHLINHSPKEWEDHVAEQERKEAAEDEAFQKLMTDVFGVMRCEGGGVVEEVNSMIAREKNVHADKQAAMYKSWEMHVYHNIQDQIGEKLRKLSPDQISSKLRYEQDRYAKAVGNHKIFCDIMNDAYNPFELSKSKENYVHYNVKNLIDPMKHDLEKEKREKVCMGEPVFQKAQCKETLDLCHWTHDQFRTTMHGHINADDEDATRKPRVMIPGKWYSRPVFWNGDWRWLKEYWNESFPTGGKAMPPKPPDNCETLPRIEKDMVWDSPVKSQRKLQISVENPGF